MRRWFVIAAALLASPAFGQEAEPKKEIQADATGTGGSTLERRLQRALDRALADVDLSEDQKARIDQMLAEFVAQHADDPSNSPRPSGPELQKLLEEMRRAREAKDEAKIKELQVRLGMGGSRAQIGQFLQQVESVLTPEQAEKFRKAQSAQERQRGAAGGDPLERIEQMRDELDLSPEQDARFDPLRDALVEALEAAKPDQDALLKIVGELREAAQAGDQARVEELREKITAPQAAREDALNTFFGSLNRMLKPEQLRVAQRYESQLLRSPAGGALDARRMIQLAKRLDLSAQQKGQLATLERSVARELREAQRDPVALKTLNEQTEADIRGILTPEQFEKFEQLKARYDRSAAQRSPERAGKQVHDEHHEHGEHEPDEP